MTEFYAHVLPCLRTPGRFKFEGLRCAVLLRVPDNYTMMAIVGAFQNKNQYDIEDVYETFNWLKQQGIISFRRQNAYRYWGERFFEYLHSCDIATFPGNKQKLGKLKARWGFQWWWRWVCDLVWFRSGFSLASMILMDDNYLECLYLYYCIVFTYLCNLLKYEKQMKCKQNCRCK